MLKRVLINNHISHSVLPNGFKNVYFCYRVRLILYNSQCNSFLCRQEEKQLRIDLFDSKVQVQSLEEKLKSQGQPSTVTSGATSSDASARRLLLALLLATPSPSSPVPVDPTAIITTESASETDMPTSIMTHPLTKVESFSQLVQTEESLADMYNTQLEINRLKTQVNQLETLLNAKDQVLSEFKILHVEPYKGQFSGTEGLPFGGRQHPETAEALQVSPITQHCCKTDPVLHKSS